MADDVLTAAEVAAIRKRADAATEGPWHYYPCGEKSNDCILGPATDENGNAPPPGRVDCDPYNEATGKFEMDKYIIEPVIAAHENDADYADFAFMAHARSDVPRLCAAVDALRAECERLMSRLDEIKRCWQDGVGQLDNPWRKKMAELVGDDEGLAEAALAR